jgi:hypothetical protein
LEIWFSIAGYGIAVLTGQKGLVVIDFDDRWEMSLWLAGLSPSLAKLVLSTYRVSTRRGSHWYFFTDEETQNGHGKGVDIKGFHGYVCAPNSVHPTGHVYRAIGHPSQIRRIESVRVLLPELAESVNHDESRRLNRQAPQTVDIEEMDALDAAMVHNPMQAGNSNGLVANIKATWSFDDLLGSGNGHRRGVTMVNCPLHHDTEPSMAIYPDGGWWCFAEMRGGDIIDLYAAMNNLTVREAIQVMSVRTL